jgi:hypothetical protein
MLAGIDGTVISERPEKWAMLLWRLWYYCGMLRPAEYTALVLRLAKGKTFVEAMALL